VARLLLDRGADLQARDAFHAGTPLRWACQRGGAEVIRLLRERGASADVFLLSALGDVEQLRARLAEGPLQASEATDLALQLARELGLDLPLASATKAQYDRMIAAGLGDLDKSGIAELTFKGRLTEQTGP